MPKNVLIVTDNTELASTLPLVFRGDSFHATVVATAGAARDAIRSGQIGAVIIDEKSGEEAGLPLLLEFAQDHPNIPRCYAAGSVDTETAIHLINRGQIFRLLRKPFDTDVLRIVAQKAIAQHHENLLSDSVINLTRLQVPALEQLEREVTAGAERGSAPTAPTYREPVPPRPQVAVDNTDPMNLLNPYEASVLSRREREILRSFIAGHRPAQIASTFMVSVHTVRNQIKTMYRKLGVHSQNELRAKVLRPRGHDTNIA